MVASCFLHLASALAETVETTLEFSVVKIKRQSLKTLRATEGSVLSLMQRLGPLDWLTGSIVSVQVPGKEVWS